MHEGRVRESRGQNDHKSFYACMMSSNQIHSVKTESSRNKNDFPFISYTYTLHNLEFLVSINFMTKTVVSLHAIKLTSELSIAFFWYYLPMCLGKKNAVIVSEALWI